MCVFSDNLSNYDDDFFNTVRPFYDYLNSDDFHGFSPLVAQKIAAEYFSSPLKNISYKHYSDVDLERPIPLFFLVPKTEVLDADLKDEVLIDEKRFCHTLKVVFRGKDELNQSSDLNKETKYSKEEDKPSDLIEDRKSSDPKDIMPSNLPDDITHEPIEEETSDISQEPPYGLFMRSDPVFDIYPDPYLRFVPPQYEALVWGGNSLTHKREKNEDELRDFSTGNIPSPMKKHNANAYSVWIWRYPNPMHRGYANGFYGYINKYFNIHKHFL